MKCTHECESIPNASKLLASEALSTQLAKHLCASSFINMRETHIGTSMKHAVLSSAMRYVNACLRSLVSNLMTLSLTAKLSPLSDMPFSPRRCNGSHRCIARCVHEASNDVASNYAPVRMYFSVCGYVCCFARLFGEYLGYYVEHTSVWRRCRKCCRVMVSELPRIVGQHFF